ncbi:hypothetical protein P691DRAFT_806278 [Macrolepiota fuliginosa MF-IS2]|uniref:Uncharacterized protein n=1 Tax=Macrolepiota fuliginosa MF-IS2 TaxID=1400762 RepID=A0A9P6C506_9AGAR|nr:hypothetical protein P691DRAFT_806278 [Macrolepiota fuliginosa MF-IS2]
MLPIGSIDSHRIHFRYASHRSLDTPTVSGIAELDCDMGVYCRWVIVDAYRAYYYTSVGSSLDRSESGGEPALP